MRLRGLTNRGIVERISPETQVIGLSCMFTCIWIYVRELVRDIKTTFPKTLIMMGGEHVTDFPEFSMLQAPIDTVVMDEDEETVTRLLHHWENNIDLDTLHGVAYRNKEV